MKKPLKTGRCIVAEVEDALKDKSDKKLIEICKNNPRYILHYVQCCGMEAQLMQLKIEKCILTMGYLLSDKK